MHGVHYTWLFRCDCGNEKEIYVSSVVSGHTTSCGCQQHSMCNYRHGKCDDRLYNIHQKMISRCYKKHDRSYERYGGRGIKVCKEWRGKNGFVSFYDWAIKNGYADGLSIDRIDFNGNYCPENCRWATAYVQQNNRRDNKYITYNGITKTLSQWCKELNLVYGRVLSRLNVLGWSVDDAFNVPRLNNEKNKRRYINT